MKIIRSGKTRRPTETEAECIECHCQFSFTKNEAKHTYDPRDGDAYVVSCPECKHDNWIAESLVN